VHTARCARQTPGLPTLRQTASRPYQLAGAGHDVTVIARPGSRRLAQLHRDHGIVLRTGERACVSVADHLDEREPFDLVIVTTLAHQVDAVLPALQRSHARCVHFMFVTPEAERLETAVGGRRATFGMAGVPATIDSDGKLDLKIGRTNSIQGDQRWVDLFRAAGMPSKLEADMGRWLRSQTPLTIAMESVAITGMQHTRGASWAEAKVGAQGRHPSKPTCLGHSALTKHTSSSDRATAGMGIRRRRRHSGRRAEARVPCAIRARRFDQARAPGGGVSLGPCLVQRAFLAVALA
jgi:hypothetical protein